MMKSLTKATMNRITADWAGQFSSLGIYRPMHLLRRCGPLLVGVCLERDSSGTQYRPTFHTHVLGKRFPTVSLTLSQPLLANRSLVAESLQVADHSKRYEEAVVRLRRQALLPFDDLITLEDTLNAYHIYSRRPNVPFPIDLYEDMILLAAWCGQQQRVSELVAIVRGEVGSWPASIIESLGGVEAWISRVLALSVPDLLSTQIEVEIRELRLEGIPSASLGCGSAAGM